MDVEVAWKNLQDQLLEDDLAEARESAVNVLHWVKCGGFTPRKLPLDYVVGFCEATIMATGRLAPASPSF